MKKINLRDLFPVYEIDCYIEVPDEDIETFLACLTKETADVYIIFERAEAAYGRRLRRYKAYYSLNRDDGIERNALYPPLNPAEAFERKLTMEQLYAAIASLPDKQAKRIYAYYFLGMSKSEISRAEGVSKVSVCESVRRGLFGMEIFLKNFF